MAKHKTQTKTASSSNITRRLELPKRHWYNPRTWRRNLPLPPRRVISSTTTLLHDAAMMLRKDWRTFTGISLVYAIGVFIFVRSFSVGTSASAKADSIGQATGRFTEAMTRLSSLLSSANTSISAASGVYQIMISTICCLALIWAFRQVLSHETATVKSSFYQGMTPLVKYLLVLAVVGVHFIPLALGGYAFSIILSSGYFFGWEIWAAGFVFAILAIWTFRLITHSMFALFIATLPDMTPLRALRSAKKMVYRRRLLIWRKLVLAGLLLCIIGLLAIAPFIIWWPAGAPWALFAGTILLLPIGQAFLYTLYREIL